MHDPYDNGIPKYSTAQDIYDALCQLVQTEEMSILSEIGVDVSWENQTYYYTEKGNALKDAFEQITDFGEKMWLLDLTIFQMNDNRLIHDLVYDAMTNSDLAKRIGFKKLFVEQMLRGNGKDYDKITYEFGYDLGEINRFDHYDMIRTFNMIAQENEIPLYGTSPYPRFAHSLSEKVRKLQLIDETKLIAECRAHLTAYDDFIYGLRINQVLHERQEQLHRQQKAELQAAYEEKLKQLIMAADRVGLLPILNAELQLHTNSNTLLENKG